MGGAVDKDGVFGMLFVKKNQISAGVGIEALASSIEAFALARDLGLEAGTFSWSGTVMGRVVCFVLLDETFVRSGVGGGVEVGSEELEGDGADEGEFI